MGTETEPRITPRQVDWATLQAVTKFYTQPGVGFTSGEIDWLQAAASELMSFACNGERPDRWA